MIFSFSSAATGEVLLFHAPEISLETTRNWHHKTSSAFSFLQEEEEPVQDVNGVNDLEGVSLGIRNNKYAVDATISTLYPFNFQLYDMVFISRYNFLSLLRNY